MLPMIGLTGLAQAGKDSAANLLVDRHGYTKLAFADPLREMAAVIDPLVGQRPVWNVRHRAYVQVPVHYREAVESIGYEAAKASFPELRRFLQRLGTEWGRECNGQNYWVRQAMERANRSNRPCVFTDVRFPNEADAIVDRGGVIVRVIRGLGIGGSHASETSMAGYPVHYELDNTADMRQLAAGVDTLVKDLERNYVPLAEG